jgi:hypothetical protein
MTLSHLSIERVYRIGVQTLSYEDGQWFIAIRNRSYQSRVALTEEQARHWRRVLMSGSSRPRVRKRKET